MNPVDQFSYLLHLAIAEKLRLNSRGAIEIARKNVDRWLSSGRFTHGAEFAYLEWRNILEKSTPEEIIRLITQQTDDGQRLRSSTPFTGILTKSERERIWSECAEVGLV